MSEIERIRAAAAHPENWRVIKVSPSASERKACVLLNLTTSWPGIQPRQCSAKQIHIRRVCP